VTISPSSLTFPPSSVGAASATQDLTFANSSNVAVVVSGVQVTGNFTAASNNCGTVAPQGTCTVRVGFIPASSGPLAGTLQFLDSASGSPHVVALSGSGVDFVASPVTNQAAVIPGATATYKLSISPTGGAFSNPVTFVCNAAPAFATCTVNPGSITPGANSKEVTVAVTTSGSVSQAQRISGSQMKVSLALLCAPMAIFSAVVFAPSRRRKFHTYVVSAVMLMLLVLVGCGGTGAPKSLALARTTPPGTYTLSVIATSGTLQHITRLTLVVH
jgi:ASPM-SPD-2-Hydin domain-containing protein